VSEAIHLWTVRLHASDEEADALETVLSPDELERRRQFKFPVLRNRFAVSRAALRILLARELSALPQDLKFNYGRYGKPYLPGASDLQFNSSHTDDLFACAMTRGSEIGLDIEKLKALPDAVQLAQSYFCPEELQQLSDLPTEEQQAAFFRCWTRKEAYLKAVGTGLSTDLNSFRVTMRPGDPPRLVHIDHQVSRAADWNLHDLDGIPGHAGAIAYSGEPKSIVRHPVWTPAELLSSVSREQRGSL
jgi:4'-phosphopantetheinyl transferase